ncbi:GNAT family N-acetyltransferase [Streptomyces sp. VRA16 Mangrove soil]|uniref:GNAT family N-acetyltransferase n=1 Tax=Streptomyces sp. VRA16 Mangrove soil TaxID=2817434 RepID=UPI001A9F0868|nr:GNAT family N-acetyltransferase [Streptomyces sp. VRA16 Mangrove soil]MBO1333065.1 GNAT family N-acetyltransferase [Streptomyces sp. VRA16 Mangrove soil]
MKPARRAVPEDAEELVRLRKIMLDSMSPSDDVDWQQPTLEALRCHLADPDGELTAFVVEDPSGSGGLAACATGVIQRSLGSPGNPYGTTGHVFNVCTDPGHRRRGYSRACMEALLAWYKEHDVRRVDLHATATGEPLYASLGFTRTPAPAMRVTL